MEFIVYTLFALAALIIASELNAPSQHVEPVTVAPQPKPAMAKATMTAPRLVIPLNDQPDPVSEDPDSYAQIASNALAAFVQSRQIESAPIDWSLWGIRELRWTATRLGIKGASRMNKVAAKAAIVGVIG